MKHRRKPIRLKSGQDANQMLLRQLLKNFITRGKIVTTQARAKALKSQAEQLISTAKRESQATRSILLKKLADKKISEMLVKEILPIFKDKNGGYLRSIRLNQRFSDGSAMVRLEWSKSVVLKKPETQKKKKAAQEKTK